MFARNFELYLNMQLLVKDPSRRMSLDDVLKHDWIRKNFLDILDEFQRARFEFSLRKSERRPRRPLTQLAGAQRVNSAAIGVDSSSSSSEASMFSFAGDTPARVGSNFPCSSSAASSSTASSSIAAQPYRPTAHAKQNEAIIVEESDSDSDSELVPRDGPPIDWQKHDDAGYATGGVEPLLF